MPLVSWFLAATCLIATPHGLEPTAPLAAVAVAETPRANTDGKDAPASEPAPIRVGPIVFSGYGQMDGLFDLGAHDPSDNGTFRVRRARVYATGDLLPNIGFALGVDLTDSHALREAAVTLRYVRAANIKVGEFVMPYSLERLTSTKDLEVIDRSVDRFTPGRDIGAMIFNAAPLAGQLSYFVAVMNGTGQSAHDNNDAKDYVGRLVWRVPRTRAVSIGVNASSGRETTGTRARWGADVNLEHGAYRVAAEYLHEREGDWSGRPGHGFYLLATRRFRPASPRPQFYMAEAAVRLVEIQDPAESMGGATAVERREVQAGGNYYFSRNVRVMADAFVPFKRFAGAPRTTLVTRLQFAF